MACIEPGTDAGKFSVEDPDGILIGVATVAVAFSAHLTFTIADGATDFVAGDSFTITVAAGSGKVKQIDFAATDGSNAPCGLLYVDTTAPDGSDRSGRGGGAQRHCLRQRHHLAGGSNYQSEECGYRPAQSSGCSGPRGSVNHAESFFQ